MNLSFFICFQSSFLDDYFFSSFLRSINHGILESIFHSSEHFVDQNFIYSIIKFYMKLKNCMQFFCNWIRRLPFLSKHHFSTIISSLFLFEVNCRTFENIIHSNGHSSIELFYSILYETKELRAFVIVAVVIVHRQLFFSIISLLFFHFFDFFVLLFEGLILMWNSLKVFS